MPCKGCANQQCNCFTAPSETVTTAGNGNQYAPYTFRPVATPFPRPFGHLQGQSSQNLDGAPYSLFGTSTVQDIDGGGNMIVGDGTRLRAPVDGLYMLSFSCRIGNTALDGLNDNVSIRKNATTILSTATYAHTSGVGSGTNIFLSSVTMADLNQNDLIDMYVERVAGAGSVDVSYGLVSNVLFFVQFWGLWVAGPILP